MPDDQKGVDAPWIGAVPAAGVASVTRIPMPGRDGLAIEFRPINYHKSSTSAIFIQDKLGKRVLRLDYGFNPKTNTIDYHWNQKGTFAEFGISDHTVAGKGAAALYKFARYYRYAGRILIVIGVSTDIVSIVQSNKPLRKTTQVIYGWAGARAGFIVGGAIGAEVGSPVPIIGNITMATVFGIIGGAVGYYLGQEAGAEVYDWGEAAFYPLPMIPKGSQL